MKLRWAREALTALDEIRRWVAQDDPVAARRLIGRLFEAASPLVDFPHLGRRGRQPSTRELFVPDTAFTLVYRVEEASVVILDVLHQARRRRAEAP